jgi:hypothetical protein
MLVMGLWALVRILLKIGAIWRREHVHAALTKKLKTFQRWMD